MKTDENGHLQDGQIICTVIDEGDLALHNRDHLLVCPLCKGKVEKFSAGLQAFGQKARQSVPPFSHPVKLPPGKQPAPVAHNAGWLPFFGAAAMAGMVVFFYFMGLTTKYPAKLATLPSQESLLEDESLMREISEMIEFPLPDNMYEITGDNGIGFEDDFLQFVVPDIEEDSQSELIIQGGVKRC